MNERSLLEEEALRYHLAGQAAVAEEAAKQSVELAPITTPEGKYQRGFIDENGEPTDDGVLAVKLRDTGIFNNDWSLTEKGQAFAMPYGESLMPQNLGAYKIRQREGLDASPETSFGEDLANVGGFVWDAVKGVTRLMDLRSKVMLPFDKSLQAEGYLGAESFGKGAMSGSAELGSGGLEMIQRWLADEDSDEWWAAKQRGDRFTDDVKDISGGEIYGHLLNSKAIVDGANFTRDAARQRLGAQRADAVEREGEAAGQLFGDPANYLTAGVGAMVGAAPKVNLMARLGTKVEDAMQAGLRATEAQAALVQANQRAMRARNGAAMAARQAEDLRSVGQVERAGQFESVATRLASAADEADAVIPGLRETMQGSAAEAQRLMEASGGAQRALAAVEQAKALGRQFRAAPARVAAPVLEGIATGMEKLDSALGPLRAIRDATAAVGLVGGDFGLAAGAAAMKVAGPVLRQTAALSRVLGDELLQTRGTVPFWRRMAENSGATPLTRALGHGMDFATLGGKVPSVIGRTAKGIAAATPLNVAFDAISQGGELSGDSVSRGLAQSVVFAGPAAMGGAIVRGTKNDLLARMAGDEINLRQRMAPEQRATFGKMDAGTRKAAATYAAAFPALRFDFTEDGPSSFNRQTNTARVNIRQGDALKPLLSHEVNHFIEAGGQIGEGVRAMLLGDAERGGLLRNRDGVLDPSFKAFADEYNRRMDGEGLPRLGLDDLALEYFNEATVNRLMDDLASGHLQARKARSEGEKALAKAIDAIVPKVPLLRNLFYRTGGALDGAGRMVPGNGILADGVRNLPGMNQLLRKGMERAFDARRVPADLPKENIDVRKVAADPVQREKLFSEFETDADGKVLVDEQGKAKPVPIEKQEAKAKELHETATKAIDAEIVADADKAEGKAEPEPLVDEVLKEFEESETAAQKERRVKPKKGGYQGTHLSARTLLALRKMLNREQFKLLLMLNRASRDMVGEAFHGIYNPATVRDKSGSPKYASRGPESYQFIPTGVKINKKGGVFFELLNVGKLMKNLRERAASEKGRALYQGNEAAILQDIEAMVQLRRADKPTPTDGYFRQKYGERWQAYKNFVDSVFGDLGVKARREANPELGEAGMSYKDTNTFESFRIDRLNSTERLSSWRTPLPFNYDAAKVNLLPRGIEAPKDEP